MKIGFYAGSFDPFTNGHLHVIKKASELFDKIVIGIGINDKKENRFDRDLMKTAIEKVLDRENITNYNILIYDKLSTDVAKENNCTFLVRGIRN